MIDGLGLPLSIQAPADAFLDKRGTLKEIGVIRASAVIQCCEEHPMHGQYMEQAHTSRCRVQRSILHRDHMAQLLNRQEAIHREMAKRNRAGFLAAN